MRLLSAWTEVGTPALVLALLTPALVAVAAFLPGRRTARFAALGLSFGALALGMVGLEAGLRWGWAALWLAVAWRIGTPRSRSGDPVPRPGGVESGAIGLLLGLALLALLISAVARQNLGAEATRSTSFGLGLIVLGLLHLMLRRDAVRALLALGSLGLGLHVLVLAARDDLLGGALEHRGAVLLASAIAVALTDRVVRARQESAKTPWVSEAHDLHD